MTNNPLKKKRIDGGIGWIERKEIEIKPNWWVETKRYHIHITIYDQKETIKG